MSQLSSKDKLLHFLRYSDILTLVRLPFILAFIQLMAWGITRDIFFKDRVLGLIDLPFFIVFFLTLSLSGFAYIWRGERYVLAIRPLRKKLVRDSIAVTMGIIYVVVFFGLMVFMIVLILYADLVSSSL